MLGDKAPNMMNLNLRKGHDSFTGSSPKIRQQFVEITPIGSQRMRRQPTLVGQLGQPGIAGGLRRHSTLLVTRASAAETISPMRSR